ncbi:lantibiotic dehydratase [Micromonospora sp. NPDC005173]|uniref:lantibiotic dehydratase n=1 Tax=Micromonospora sp. NPDC005173 TaxID=3157165 RepID=UPI0033B8F58D
MARAWKAIPFCWTNSSSPSTTCVSSVQAASWCRSRRAPGDGPAEVLVRYSRPVATALARAREGINFACLTAKLAADHAGRESQLREMLRELRGHGVLVSELRRPADVTDPLRPMKTATGCLISSRRPSTPPADLPLPSALRMLEAPR